MMTNPSPPTDRAAGSAGPTTTAQKVVIVNGTTEILAVLETVLDAGHYDLVFVESSQHAYSQIKRVQPDLVILCVRMEDGEGLQVLSMLKLDAATCAIPVLTYASEIEEQSEEDVTEPSEVDTLFAATKTAVLMN